MMRRTPMKPGKGFARQAPAWHERDPDRVRETPTARPGDFRAPAPVVGHAEAVEKEGALQHEKYMALVRLFPCARCGIVGFTQFCHADEGKGTGLKTDCRRGWPGCGPHGDDPGCHWLVGTSGRIPREERRALEAKWGRETRDRIRAMNLWPKGLADWSEDDGAATR